MNSWVIPQQIFDAMAANCEEGYPEEACGLIFGPEVEGDNFDTGPLKLVVMENIQNKMRERDPERFDRDARTAYYFDPVAFNQVKEEGDEAGLVMRSIYHSHPDHDAYFSKKDREEAAPPGWGGPLFPGSVYIVFSVREAKVVDVKGYLWSDEEEDFLEMIISRAR